MMLGLPLAGMGMVAWVFSNMGPHLEPRWLWVWSDSRYQHLLDALDAHEPVWTEPDVASAILTGRSRSAGVNWVMGLVPVSERHFLVVDVEGISLSLYPATAANAAYWAHRKSNHAFDGPGSTAPDFMVSVSRGLDPGHHAVAFPRAFDGLEEILILYNTTNQSLEPARGGYGPVCLMIARPKVGDVEVIPLDWWNRERRFWPHSNVERLFRDSVTGRLFGDGSYLRPFVLKEHPRELEAWLR